jgi:hypothetical protein
MKYMLHYYKDRDYRIMLDQLMIIFMEIEPREI